MNKREKGNKGESEACEFLKKKGYTIVAQNYRIRSGEIDIIAGHKKTLIFVEVKKRKDAQFGLPREAVGPRKQRAIIFTSLAYLQSNQISSQTKIRYDVIEVYEDGKIVWIQDAFSADGIEGV